MMTSSCLGEENWSFVCLFVFEITGSYSFENSLLNGTDRQNLYQDKNGKDLVVVGRVVGVNL